MTGGPIPPWGWRRSDPGPRRWRAAGRVAALVVGALPALAFPAPSWWWLAWVGVVPLLLVVRAAPTARELCDNSFEATSETVRRGTSPGSFILAMPVSQLKFCDSGQGDTYAPKVVAVNLHPSASRSDLRSMKWCVGIAPPTTIEHMPYRIAYTEAQALWSWRHGAPHRSA